jgi:hypothetical protein
LRARGLKDAEARRMLLAQLPSAVKRAWRGGTPPRAALVIDNDEDRITLAERARQVWEQLST